MLSACWSVCNARTSIREHGNYLKVLGTQPFRSRSIATIRSLSSSDIIITQMELPSARIGLWSIRLALLGLWSISPSSPGLGSITASLSDHQVSWQRLRPTHAFQHNTTVTHAVSPPAVSLIARGSRCIAFRFMTASENIGCCAGF